MAMLVKTRGYLFRIATWEDPPFSAHPNGSFCPSSFLPGIAMLCHAMPCFAATAEDSTQILGFECGGVFLAFQRGLDSLEL